MRSNYKRLGDFIQLVDVRNNDLAVDTLLGLSTSKQFIPSVANTIGTNMKKYKIIKNNQFACSIMQVRRDKKMPIALLKDSEQAIISQAYPAFEVVDENILLPDYLMMWFSREEFDRQATFWAVGGVRGSLEWADFLDFELPIPTIEEQRAIVAEYQTVTDRIKLNEQINTKLEETAQALYRHWFVDFEFPDDNGKPYKSSGGNMVFNEELEKEVPEGWEVEYLYKFLNIKHGYAFKGESIVEEENNNILLTPGNFKIGGGIKLEKTRYYKGEIPNDYILKGGDIIVTMTDLSKKCDTLGYPAIIPTDSQKSYLHNQRLGKIERAEEYSFFYFYLMCSKDYRNWIVGGSSGTTVKHTSPTKILAFQFSRPNENSILRFIYYVKPILEEIEQNQILNLELENANALLLSKMAESKSTIEQKAISK